MKGMWLLRCVADGSFTPKWRNASFMLRLLRAANAIPAERHPLVSSSWPEISFGERVDP